MYVTHALCGPRPTPPGACKLHECSVRLEMPRDGVERARGRRPDGEDCATAGLDLGMPIHSTECEQTPTTPSTRSQCAAPSVADEAAVESGSDAAPLQLQQLGDGRTLDRDLHLAYSPSEAGWALPLVPRPSAP